MVVAVTASTRRRTLVTVRAAKGRTWSAPPSGRAPVRTLEPSENSTVAAVMPSAVPGLSDKATPVSVTGAGKSSWIQAPAPSPAETHSRAASMGAPVG